MVVEGTSVSIRRWLSRFSQGFPGNVAQGNQGGAHRVMTGEGNQGGVGSVFNACAGGQAGVPNLAANGQDPSSFTARNLENDPWRMNKLMAVGRLMVVVIPVVSSLDFKLCLDLEG